MNLQNKKAESLVACPNCKTPSLILGNLEIKCGECGETYLYQFGTPVLIKRDSPVFEWYKPEADSRPLSSGFIGKLTAIYWRLRPEARIWTRASQKALKNLLGTVYTGESAIVLIGAGFESVYKRILSPYRNILRIGLATRGEVDLLTDICDIPLRTDSVDLIFSSSVLEHVYNPEQAVREMFRVVKPGGYVYAEIPFMRAYHMAPVDYQRYTISGIEELFKRHGFRLIEKGVCSGPFTALALFLVDFFAGLFSFNKYMKAVASLVFSILLHPVKYLDRFVENFKWSEINACNFYYIGKK
jgi:SAM-dependent methyltransferase